MIRRLLLVAFLPLLVAGCASSGMVGNAFEPGVYVVRPGDTLYSIAWRYQVDYHDLVRWNDIDNPDQLRVGRRLRLGPPRHVAQAAPAPANVPAAQPQARSGVDAGAPDAAADAANGHDEAPAAAGGHGDWRWPTSGHVIGTFDDGVVAGRGVDIEGEYGQAIQATAAGEVVYSGKGLQAYGRLVIIRHAGEYLSAYAHNSRLLVQEGQRVAAGQQIARMGRSNDGRSLLHFEIRRQGKPVDPLDYLPPRQ